MVKLKYLPIEKDLETKSVLKQLIKTHGVLAELKGFSEVIPNKHILVNAAMINEAKDSSEIENIVTTHDEIYKSLSTNKISGDTKEVINYREALWYGFEEIEKKGYLSINMIIEIQSILEENDAGIRRQAGTVLKNVATGQVVYTPPQSYNEIMDLMSNLEKYINYNDDTDDLVKLAIIHYQFESIHPFYDGNGRTGRIINVLYLTLKKYLDSPIIYISKYINKNKNEYYQVLQGVRENDDFEQLIMFMLTAIEKTAYSTLEVLKKIVSIIKETEASIRELLPKLYSKELVEVLFYEFYTNIELFGNKLNISRRSASTYLIALEEAGFIKSEIVGRNKVYLNTKLFDVIKRIDF